MGATTAKSSIPTLMSATELHELHELIQQLKFLTASEAREVILSLCVPGKVYKGFVDEIKTLVKALEAKKGITNHQDGLPLHLFDLTKEELGLVILEISRKNNIALKRVQTMVAKILAGKWYQPEPVEGQKTKPQGRAIRGAQ